MRSSILTLSIVVCAVSASPCRPSSSETSAETTTAAVSYASTSAVPSSTELPIEATTTAASTESASQTSSGAESTTESTAAATSTAAVAPLCRAPAALQCCNNVETASSPAVSLLLGLLGIVIKDQSTVVGTACSAIDDVGACNKTPVCCNDNSHGGLVSIGCTRVRE